MGSRSRLWRWPWRRIVPMGCRRRRGGLFGCRRAILPVTLTPGSSPGQDLPSRNLCITSWNCDKVVKFGVYRRCTALLDSGFRRNDGGCAKDPSRERGSCATRPPVRPRASPAVSLRLPASPSLRERDVYLLNWQPSTKWSKKLKLVSSSMWSMVYGFSRRLVTSFRRVGSFCWVISQTSRFRISEYRCTRTILKPDDVPVIGYLRNDVRVVRFQSGHRFADDDE